MDLRETYRILLAELSVRSKISSDPQKFCNSVVKTFYPYFIIDAMAMVVRFDEDTLDTVLRFNKTYARLDQNRFVKIHRKTPLTDAMRLQTNQVIGTNHKLIFEYPEALTWPIVPHSIVAVPIVVDGVSVAGCAWAMHDEFSGESEALIASALDAATHMLYQVYQRSLQTPDTEEK